MYLSVTTSVRDLYCKRQELNFLRTFIAQARPTGKLGFLFSEADMET